ncbi:hypothetical protein MYX82_03905 [Acidobacteria bacterium AH-259-D05]|nr:hypothetical protein [Acidobacteria bacterium AH-259-D05]
MEEYPDKYRHEDWEVTFEGTNKNGLWEDQWSATLFRPESVFQHGSQGTRNFKTRNEAIMGAIAKAKNWIETVGREIVRMGIDRAVDMNSPGACNCPFDFKGGDKISLSYDKQVQGVIATGVFYENSATNSYRIYYEIQTPDRSFFRAEQGELELSRE